ncbi:transcription antitermination factor NusB [Riemerella anatipestifer]|uniref:transcription antitermination factor NusB n=1 Tax=Riemerella anatipestifer TaxID=34085 RepID=UPI0012AD62E9|nr:transcription antitermination factor NusB [Riemerella anatipestifer]MDY3521230.1 transcription antitermination factor NusB [Riemerella anatipestifer]MDY3534142.1 transcription antitermination factor NusB [Riemerella anatipestifer]MDY3535735.1 transcription antitermination factor NusB [Riemerella anatipestifer]USL95972.1 transcription antitermination factor NusB [Riemerella anatipestifer]
MLGRRQIREKVVQTLYAYQQNPLSQDALQRKMFSEIEKIYHLYVYQLNFLVGLKHLAEHQMEISKGKFLKTEEDLNPNQKFIRNQVLENIENNQERLSFTSKHQNLKWDLDDDLLVKTFQRMKAGKRYQDFMQNDEVSFEDDQKFLGKLFLRYVAENEAFHELMEEKEISWVDDLHISNTMIQKTIGFIREGEPSHTLIKIIKDEEDRSFAQKLLQYSLSHWEDTEIKLKERLKNWELDRVSLMDRVILIAAITELDHFPLTPSKVIINEYIEISKAFSTDKSQVFINGLLGKYAEDINRF